MGCSSCGGGSKKTKQSKNQELVSKVVKPRPIVIDGVTYVRNNA